ncbi:MAG: FeoB-associated Cys-rich membrane protein [Bacteroidales bacterium]|nr:FeoB-associated Cys-rich membrane protein [Bacteroidales bacterium]MDE6256288.1 FeoB-associated Cys-rich membrane protein [Muribaculaceae bacterium]
MTVQYIIVFLILAAAVGWIAYKLLFKKNKHESGGCCGCALSKKCSKPDKGKGC